jgi:Uncharacterized protein/domain associated with GTPases
VPRAEALRHAAADEVVKRYSLYAAGGGLIPLPWLDLAAIAAIELKMVAELGEIYDLPFERDRVKPIVASLIGGYTSLQLGTGAGGSLLKSIPLVGSLLGMVAVPAFAAGVTFAIGKVFITHFASGGTFLDFNPDETLAAYSKKIQGNAA